MPTKEWYHREHGDKLHDLVRFLVERYITDRGGVVRDGTIFKKRKSPCEPDVYFQYDTVLIKGNRRLHQRLMGVVEVETSASAESIRKKQEQYEQTMTGVKLVILDLSLLDDLGLDWRVWTDLERFIEERMPL